MKAIKHPASAPRFPPPASAECPSQCLLGRITQHVALIYKEFLRHQQHFPEARPSGGRSLSATLREDEEEEGEEGGKKRGGVKRTHVTHPQLWKPEAA